MIVRREEGRGGEEEGIRRGGQRRDRRKEEKKRGLGEEWRTASVVENNRVLSLHLTKRV